MIVFETHEHRDHLPAEFTIKLVSASPLVPKLKRIYRNHVELEEYKLFKNTAKEYDIELSEFVRGTLLKAIGKRLGLCAGT